tara:strand:+ start:2146 stop:2814 length:669 start_codon:yes stop_codon:yes gene_type:complete
MKVISWDIGIKNLAYCLFEDNTIIDWNIIDISIPTKKKKLNLISEKLIKNVNNDKYLNVDYVLIENQPCLKNPTMKSIQMILYSIYMIHKCNNNTINILLINASNKLKVYTGPEIELGRVYKSKYTIRKKMAIRHTQYFLKDNPKQLLYLNNHKKKDDLCDTYLQGLYFYKKLLCPLSRSIDDLKECKYCNNYVRKDLFYKIKRGKYCYQCYNKIFKLKKYL